MINWTEELIEIVRQGLKDGLSSTRIAGLVGRGCSRNAIIGLVRRRSELREIGFTRKPDSLISRKRLKEPSVKQELPAAAPRLAKKQRVSSICADPIPQDVVPEKPPLMLSLMQLNERTCKYPIGDPRSESFGFCGHAKKLLAGPYCEFHTSRTNRAIQRK